jgi:hypothetical protein
MLNKREKILLNILLWTVVITFLGIYLLLEINVKAALQERIELVEKQLKRYRVKMPDENELIFKRDNRSEELSEVKYRFYIEQDIDTYRFGIIIHDLLVSSGLEINRYQTIEVGKNTFLEFSVRGNALGFISFLKSVSLSDKYWHISYVSINSRSGNGAINSVFRIGYEKYNKMDN